MNADVMQASALTREDLEQALARAAYLADARTAYSSCGSRFASSGRSSWKGPPA
jgi:hypothetical protein